MSRLTDEELWVRYAAAALSGAMASDVWPIRTEPSVFHGSRDVHNPEEAAEWAAKAADELVDMHRRRFSRENRGEIIEVATPIVERCAGDLDLATREVMKVLRMPRFTAAIVVNFIHRNTPSFEEAAQ